MRVIIEADIAELDFALRAIKFIVEQPWRDAVISYEKEGGPDFYIKQNKKSLSVRKATRSK